MNWRKLGKQQEKVELSLDGDEIDDDYFDKEENTNIRNALDWKRNHFFVACLMVTVFLMLKFEYSYTKMFAANITTFLIMFVALDIFIEQLLTRMVMSEALLVTPILGTFVITEFIMTMGAEDFRAFILSYFIETIICLVNRVYIGPIVEGAEAKVQGLSIEVAKRNKWFRTNARNILIKQLAGQLQLMSLNEYKSKRTKLVEDKVEAARKVKFEWQMEKGEGMEALLGSMNTYAGQT